MHYLDAYVIAIVLERLARAKLRSTLPGEDVIAPRCEADESALASRRRPHYVAGNLSAATLSRVEAQLTAAISDAERRGQYAGLPTTVAELVDAEAAWDDLSVEQRRESFRGLITRRVNR